jgi:cellobiose phosphorylase
MKDRNDISSYYLFNDNAKEVTFNRHDTPSPWMNYLTNGTFHTMLSQAGGGVSFYKSPQIWRINRYRFFHLPTDRSGHYIYIKDNKTGEYWCPTYEPAQASPEKWLSTHGMGYTRFEAERDGISANVKYFVGEFENSLIWNCKIKNTTNMPKEITVFAYVEFGMMEFMRELQWQCYNKHQVSVKYMDNKGAILYKYGVEMQPKPDETPLVYLVADRIPDAYDGDRDEFIGTYRSESNPYAIENGGCTNSTLAGGDPCGALQFNITLEANSEQTLNVFLGTGMTEQDIEKSIVASRKSDFVQKSFDALSSNWDGYLEKLSCNIPDKDAERQINIWNPYQAHKNFLFSRNISFYATGTFRGVGFRDTAQDILAMVPFDIEASKDKVKLLLTQQYNDGHVNHYFFPTEGWEPVKSIHSDDHLWTALAVNAIVTESGKTDFLDDIVPYFDGGEGTIYEHLKKAIEFTKVNLGERGFPLMLRSDWNDQLFRVCRQGKGESIWTAMQLGTTLKKMIELCEITGNEADKNDYIALYESQKKLVNSIAWDGKWFRRAIMDNGKPLGSEAEPQAKIWLNSQTWSVISQMADSEKGISAMDSVKEMLDTELGIKKIHPSITDYPSKEDPLTNYNPGTGENGAVFCHANTWAIIAECMLGRGENAYKYYRQLIPNVAMEKAGVWKYKAEPYVYVSNIFGPESDKFGMANVSWLTGTAAWMYIAATQYILGVRATWEGLQIDPCVPSDWKEFSIEREFRGSKYIINFKNESSVNKGVKKITVDGTEINGNIIPQTNKSTPINVEVIM